MLLRRLLPILLAVFAATAHAARDDNAQIRTAVEKYLSSQTAGMPGQASFTVSSIENGAGRPACQSLSVSMAPGARSIGRTTVLVRCSSGANWAVYVPVQIRLIAKYVVTRRPLSQNQMISANDITTQSGDLSNLPGGVLLSPDNAIGRVTTMPIPAGRPLLTELLRQAPVIQAGQTVRAVSRGPGFEVTNEGHALTAAVAGQVVRVRLNNGQMISGIARAGGIVEIAF